MKKTNLFIFDGQTDKQVAVLSNKNNKQLTYSEDTVTEQLNKDFTFDFTVPLGHKDSQHLVKGNRVVFKDIDGEYQEFQIYKTEEDHSSEIAQINVFTEHAIYEIIDDIVEDLRVPSGDPNEAMTKGLSASRWEPGFVAPLSGKSVNFYYSNGIENLTAIQNAFGGEFKYRVLLSEDKKSIGKRLVDLVARRGEDTGKRYEYTKDLVSIKRTVDSSGIKTALYGRGKGEETEDNGYTRKQTIATVQWRTEDGYPVDKPLGQEWIGDPDSLKQFGRQGGTRHRFGVFEVDSTDATEIINATWEQLQQVNKPSVTYEAEGQDLEVFGFTHEKVRLGDTVALIDKVFTPALRIEARVIEIKRSLSDPSQIEIVLGNFIPLATDLANEVEEIKAKLTDRQGVWDSVENIEVSEVTDASIQDIIPKVPTNPVATGLFKSIAVEWDFDPSLYIAAYEVYGSTTKGFVTDSTNLLYRGKTGGYVHKADTNQTWYFRIRAINTHGKASDLTDEFNASTIRIQTADYEDLSIVNAKIADLSVDASKIAKASITDAEIKSLNADKIVAGRLKAQFVEIGAKTVYTSTDYDPTTKATPDDVSEAETRAISHADSAASTAETNAKSHADEVAEAKRVLAEENANAYADGIVTAEENERIKQAVENLKAANSHADSAASTAESNAKSHADNAAKTAEQNAKDYALPSRSEIYDPTFRLGSEFWSTSYTGVAPKAIDSTYAVDSADTMDGGKLLQVKGNFRAFSVNPIPVNTNRVYRVTMRVRQTVDTSIEGTSRVYAGVATLDKDLNEITGGAGTHRYCAVAGSTIVVGDGWQTFTGLITGEGDTSDTFRPGTKYVRPMFIVNYNGGDGTAEVDLIDFEDVTEVQELIETVNEVDLRTTETSIIATVMESQEYESEMLKKANSTDLENYATGDELAQTRTELEDSMDNKIAEIDFEPYATKTFVEQTAEDLDFKFTSSGGVNLLKNSVGFSGTDFWAVTLDKDSYGVTTGEVDSRQDSEMGERGVGSGFVLNGAKIRQTVVNTATFHTLAFLVKKDAAGSGYAKVYYDDKVETITFDSGTDYDYTQFKAILQIEGNSIDVEFYGSVGSNLVLTAVMLNVGNTALQWQHSSGEIYNANVLMDLNGIRVISNKYNGYTSITPEEFSGYAEVDGEMERVFTLNKDVTEMSKVQVQNEIAMSPIKIVPVNSGAYHGWAFIGE